MKQWSVTLVLCLMTVASSHAVDVGFNIPANSPVSPYDRDYLKMPNREDPKRPADDLILFQWVFGETDRGSESGFPLSPCEFSKKAMHDQALVDLLEKNPAGDERQFLLEVRQFPLSFVSALPKCKFLSSLRLFLQKLSFESKCDLKSVPTCPGYSSGAQK